jgi:hypothetical protein
MVRDARDVCGSRVCRAGREEQRGDEPQRGWRTLGRAPTLRGYSHRVFFYRYIYKHI